MTTKPQSDADVAREIERDCFKVDYKEEVCIYGTDRDMIENADFDREKATALIAQHVAARTKPYREYYEARKAYEKCEVGSGKIQATTMRLRAADSALQALA